MVLRERVFLRRATCALLVAVAVVSAVFLAPGVAAANQFVTVTIPDPQGYIPSKWLPYSGPPRAAVLLPSHYDKNKRYPLAIFLGGLGLSYAETAAAMPPIDLDAIVVIPEPGNGWFTDWWNDGQRGDPAWESYYLDDVIPYVLANYKIRPERQYHAIVGVSMGGLGATYLGGRLPGFFGSVATLSGFVDLGWGAPIVAPGMGLASNANAPNAQNYRLNAVDGPWTGFYYAGHNPTRLTNNLRNTRVFETTGNGVPSRSGLTAPTAVPEGSALEAAAIYPMNQFYSQALVASGVDVTYQVHSGGHDIPDFVDEINAMLTWGLFKPVATTAGSWVNDTVATRGQLWDIGYRFAQPPNAVVRFRRSGNSLSISAAGSSVTITTSGDCAISTSTPAVIPIPDRTCT
jgi:S-formylglutathione hydrolase FrmB